MKNKTRPKKPFVFRPDIETLKQFKNASAEDKLNWLEEANRFVHDFVPPEKLERWKKSPGDDGPCMKGVDLSLEEMEKTYIK